MTKKDWRKFFNKLWKHTYKTESGCKVIITTDLSLTSDQLNQLKNKIEKVGFDTVEKRNQIVFEVAMQLIKWKSATEVYTTVACDYWVNPRNQRDRLMLSID